MPSPRYEAILAVGDKATPELDELVKGI